MGTVKFPEGMDASPTIAGDDKLMIAKATTGEAMQATFDSAKQYLNITSIEVKAVSGGATEATAVVLYPGPDGQDRKMSGVTGWFKNATGSAWLAPTNSDNTNWWDGTAKVWSLGSSVPLPDSSAKAKDWISGTYNKGDMRTGTDGLVYKVVTDSTTQEPKAGNTDWAQVGDYNIVAENFLQNGSKNNIAIWLSGYYNSSDTKLSDSLKNTVSGLYSTSPTSIKNGIFIRVYYTNSSVFASSSAGKLIKANGDFIRNILPAEFSHNTAEKYYELNINGIASLDRVLITAYKANVVRIFVYSKLNEYLLDKDSVANMAAESGVLVKNETLFDSPQTETVDVELDLSFKNGYYSTSSTNVDTLTISDTIKSTELIVLPETKIDSYVYLQGVGLDAFTNSVGKIVDDSGVFTKNITKSADLIADENGYKVLVEGSDKLIITVRAEYIDILKVIVKEAIETVKIKASLLPEIPIPVSGEFQSIVKQIYTAADYYAFNLSASKYFKDYAINNNVEDEYHSLFIFAGQSNMAGRLTKAMAPQWLIDLGFKLANYLLWNQNANTFLPYNIDTNNGGDEAGKFGIDLLFAKKYLDEYGGKIYGIKQAVGAIPISEKGNPAAYRWQPNKSVIPVGELSMFSELELKKNNAFKFANDNNLNLLPKAIIWHQGEGDASDTTSSRLNDFDVNMRNLIGAMKGIFSMPSLPMINAEVMYYSSRYIAVNSKFFQINTEDKFFKTVSMSDYQTTIDNVHYDLPALDYMCDQMLFEFKKF